MQILVLEIMKLLIILHLHFNTNFHAHVVILFNSYCTRNSFILIKNTMIRPFQQSWFQVAATFASKVIDVSIDPRFWLARCGVGYVRNDVTREWRAITRFFKRFPEKRYFMCTFWKSKVQNEVCRDEGKHFPCDQIASMNNAPLRERCVFWSRASYNRRRNTSEFPFIGCVQQRKLLCNILVVKLESLIGITLNRNQKHIPIRCRKGIIKGLPKKQF